MRVLDSGAIAALVPSRATIAISGGGYRVTPEALITALSDRFRETAAPRNLTVVAIAMVERARAGAGGAGTGLNQLAVDGLISKVIVSSFARTARHELNQLILEDRVAAHDLPMGTLVQLLMATAAGRRGYATPVGIGTFVDPRLQGGRMSGRATESLARVVELEGEELLYYPRLPIDVAFVQASAADDRGNLYFDRAAFDHGTLAIAMATHQNGGKVFAEVNRIVARNEIHPRLGRVPGRLVSALTVNPEVWDDEQDPELTGERVVEMSAPPTRNLPRDLIARVAVSRLAPSSLVNLGAGVPMYEVPEAARVMERDDLQFTVEQGPVGGWPRAGGVSRNPELILDQPDVFQFYEGGGPDVSILSFGELDRHGNVNVSRFANMLPGCGGFINIVHGVRKLIFCGTLTTGGLVQTVTSGGLDIEQEGRIRRFVPEVEQVNFNARLGLAAGKDVSIVTDRGVFKVTSEGLVLTDVVPGVDLQRGILDQIAFPVRVASDLQMIDARLLSVAPTAPGQGGNPTVEAATMA